MIDYETLRGGPLRRFEGVLDPIQGEGLRRQGPVCRAGAGERQSPLSRRMEAKMIARAWLEALALALGVMGMLTLALVFV